MLQSDKGADAPDKDMKLSSATNPENGVYASVPFLDQKDLIISL